MVSSYETPLSSTTCEFHSQEEGKKILIFAGISFRDWRFLINSASLFSSQKLTSQNISWTVSNHIWNINLPIVLVKILSKCKISFFLKVAMLIVVFLKRIHLQSLVIFYLYGWNVMSCNLLLFPMFLVYTSEIKNV